MKPALKPPRSKRLNLTDDKLLSNVAFKINLRRCNPEAQAEGSEYDVDVSEAGGRGQHFGTDVRLGFDGRCSTRHHPH
jgi:hypothetical protein